MYTDISVINYVQVQIRFVTFHFCMFLQCVVCTILFVYWDSGDDEAIFLWDKDLRAFCWYTRCRHCRLGVFGCFVKIFETRTCWKSSYGSYESSELYQEIVRVFDVFVMSQTETVTTQNMCIIIISVLFFI